MEVPVRILVPLLVLAGCAGDKDTPADTSTTDTSPTDTTTGETTEELGEPLTVDGVDYYPVTVTQQPDPNYLRLQINYGPEEQLGDNPTETGQNSTFGLTLTLTEAPTGSGSWDWTSNRFPADATVVNGYLTFFFDTGHPQEGLNFLSPDAGTLAVDLANGRWTSSVAAASWTDEGGSATTVDVAGTIDVAWSP